VQAASVARNCASATPLEQHELRRSLPGLLVDAHQLEVALERPGRAAHRQAGSSDRAAQALERRGVEQARAAGQVGRHHHACAHRFPVQPVAVTEPRLDRVAEGVAEIERGAQSRLALVGGHHRCLDLARPQDRVGERRAIAGAQRREVALEPPEVRRIGDRAVLDHFGQSGGQLARRQRAQGVHVGEHQLRLVECTDHVLAQRVIDRGLAADRGIDLRQQRGRHLHEVDAALVDRGREAGEVADHPAAERHQQAAPVEALAQQPLEDAIERLPILVGLAIGKADRHERRGAGQRRGEPCLVEPADRIVGDHRDLPPPGETGQRIVARQQPGADQDRIATLAERDTQFADSHAGCRGPGTGRGPPARPRAAPWPALGQPSARPRLGPDFLGKTPDYIGDQLVHRCARTDHCEVRDLAIQRLAQREQLRDPLARILRLQQRSRAVAAQPLPQVGERRLQEDHQPALGEQVAVLRAHHRAASGGEHDRGQPGQFVEQRRLTATKTLFALEFEHGRDRHAAALLEHLVGVDETAVQACRESPADGGLARAHHAHQDNRPRRGAIGRRVVRWHQRRRRQALPGVAISAPSRCR